jgi:hypothetical protein
LHIRKDFGMSSIHIPNITPCSQFKAQPAPVQPAPVKEGTFNFDKVSNIFEEDDIPAAPAKVRTAAANVPGDKTTHVAPTVVKSAVKSNRAFNIDLLFDSEKGKPSVCKYCK